MDFYSSSKMLQDIAHVVFAEGRFATKSGFEKSFYCLMQALSKKHAAFLWGLDCVYVLIFIRLGASAVF